MRPTKISTAFLEIIFVSFWWKSIKSNHRTQHRNERHYTFARTHFQITKHQSRSRAARRLLTNIQDNAQFSSFFFFIRPHKYLKSGENHSRSATCRTCTKCQPLITHARTYFSSSARQSKLHYIPSFYYLNIQRKSKASRHGGRGFSRAIYTTRMCIYIYRCILLILKVYCTTLMISWHPVIVILRLYSRVFRVDIYRCVIIYIIRLCKVLLLVAK